MKNFIYGIAFTLTFAATAAYAGFFDSITTSGWPTVKSNAYLIEVKGYDVRAYDFVSKDGKSCTAVFGSKGPVGVGCK